MATKKSAGAKTKQKSKGMSTKTAVEVGAGVLAAAAAGYYFYADKDAKRHRQAANKWAKDMKKDVLKEARKVKLLDKKTVGTIVDRATAVYQGVRSVDAAHLKAAAAELKRNWKAVEREIAGVKVSSVKTGKGKKTTRKTTATVVTRPKKKAATKKKVAKKTAKKKSAKKRS